MSGETRPGDWANVSVSDTAATNSSHRRERGVTSGFAASAAALTFEADAAGLATVAVLDPVEHR
ncbi:hypothetical protein LAUMK15_00556 [Mycobacterium persicum]|nr:hypothetical protein LAUMK15_00556 [Mycobacterium persicum]